MITYHNKYDEKVNIVRITKCDTETSEQKENGKIVPTDLTKMAECRADTHLQVVKKPLSVKCTKMRRTTQGVLDAYTEAALIHTGLSILLYFTLTLLGL